MHHENLGNYRLKTASAEANRRYHYPDESIFKRSQYAKGYKVGSEHSLKAKASSFFKGVKSFVKRGADKVGPIAARLGL